MDPAPEDAPGHYVVRAGRRLRLGVTTGTCAALAARAAARLLLSGERAEWVEVATPRGPVVRAPVVHLDGGRAAVRKDAGDDPDVTDGLLIVAEVARRLEPGVAIDGGPGVGRVTLPGLDQPVGAAAINSTPRRMIARAVLAECRRTGYDGGLTVTIVIPGGEEVAKKTFNPRLGIAGGLSVIGTGGMVEPMSTQAIVDTMAVEMDMRRAAGDRAIVVTPGNYGEAFLRSQPGLAERRFVRSANFIGEALDLAGERGFAGVLLVGHAGKLIKVAGGVMDTHSRVADCRLDLLALHAGLAGAPWPDAQAILDCPTVDAGLELLDARGLADAVIASLLARIDLHLERRAAGRFRTGAIMFTNARGLLGRSPGAEALLADWPCA